MRPQLRLTCIGVCLLFLTSGTSFAQFPGSVICEFERIATAEPGPAGKLVSGGESDTGELVISNLNSDRPVASGNIGAVTLQVLKRSKDTIWLAEITPNEVAGVITLFSKSRIVMYTKHEILHSVHGDIPFGFVEIGRFRPLK